VIGGVSLGLMVAGLVATRVGRTIDARGGRPVLATGALLLAAGLALLAAAPWLWLYLVAWLVLGAGMGACLYDAAFSTLGRLYGSGARGAITALTLWGGFASTVCWPLSALLVESVGWRGTCLGYAALHLTVTLPLCLWLVPREESRPRAAAAGQDAALPFPAPPAPTFLLLAAILTTAGGIAAVWSVHLIAILQAGGLGLAAAVGLGALVGPAQVGARIVEMMFGSRYHPIWTLAAAGILIAVGLMLLWTGFHLPAAALIAYGAGNGIWSIARGTLPLCLWLVPREEARPRAAAAGQDAALPFPAPPVSTFLLLAAILTTAGGIAAVWSVHLIAILQAGGLGLAAAVGLGALVGPAQVGARIVEMMLGSRYHPIWTLAAAGILIAVGLMLLWTGFRLPAAALIAYGAGNGIWSIARGTLPLALFGPTDYAVLMGRLAAPSLLAQALAPLAGALVMARYGAEATLGAIAALAAVNVLGIALLSLLTRPGRAAHPVAGA
jgi:MFS family permease